MHTSKSMYKGIPMIYLELIRMCLQGAAIGNLTWLLYLYFHLRQHTKLSLSSELSGAQL